MDGSRFDAWTRRQFGFAAGGLLATMVASGLETDVAAKKRDKKRKKRCGRNKKRCQGKCIKRSQCCTDGDCPADTHCCEGDCVNLDRPCRLDGYACFADDGVLRLSVEGDVYCTRTSDASVCAQCASSEGCLADERCFPNHCAEGVTAVCRKVYVDF